MVRIHTFFLGIITAMVSVSIAKENSSINFGMLFMVGGRYDNMRMCVATPAGVKGGPMADIMLRVTYSFNERFGAGIEIPVMRPVLFGAAFKMLQFEPQVVFQYSVPGNKTLFIAGPAIGASFHYGPDYKSDNKNRSPSFFAAGPMIGIRGGFLFRDGKDEYASGITIRPFYASLFSREHGRGTVVGGAAEYIRMF